jgi:tetratricopeptide (TPR) repeat protein
MKQNKIFIKAQKAFLSNNFDKCITLSDQLIIEEPENITYLMLRGEAYLHIEKYDLALIDFAKVVEIDNKNITALINFGVSLIRTKRQADAKEILEYVLQLSPANFDAHINLGNVFQTLRQPEKALKVALRAVELNPGSTLAYNNLATALGDLGYIEDSRQALLTAYEIDPNSITAAINLAQVEEKIDNRREAIALYEKALEFKNITPSYSNLINYYLSYSYLYFGDLEKGWTHYDLGFGSLLPVGAVRSIRSFKQNKWNGEPIPKGQKLLIWREQGLGDEIDFSTCLFDLAAMDIEVILECEARLVDIFKRTFPKFEIRAELIGHDTYSVAADFDLHCAIGSLPGIFRKNIKDFKNQKPLFTPKEDLYKKFLFLLQTFKEKTLVGISWRGGMLTTTRNSNYSALTDWKVLLVDKRIQFVNLQYGDCESEIVEAEDKFGIKILRWRDLDLKNDLESLIALISNLDYVVSVGTAVSSIAPATGTPTLLLSKKSWIMLGEDKRYPWFSEVTPLIANFDEHIAKKIPDAHRIITSAQEE